MRTRHKIPSVFNLYMVDVLCCALGCVILVWQLDMEKVKENEQATSLKKAEADRLLTDTKSDLDKAYSEIEKRKAALTKLEGEDKNLKNDLTGRAARIADLEKQLRESEARAAALAAAIEAGDLKLKETRADAAKKAADWEALRAALEKKATDLTSRLNTTEKKSSDLGTKLTDADRKLLELAAQLAAAEKQNKDLKPLADLVPGLRAQLTKAQLNLAALQKESDLRGVSLTETKSSLKDLQAAKAAAELALKRKTDELALALTFEDKWKTAQSKLSVLEKEISLGKTTLAAADRDLVALRGEKRNLETEVVRIRQAADNRFAGITLTGRRIVFLVDMSGSMEYVDEKTKAPNKWAEVRETLLKVMKSLPDLEKFQVIVFAERASFLIGKPDEWIDYDAKTSLTQVETAMKSLKPDGGTNMYAALDAAFRYRPRGLDTIYLFSDGLPNAGEGVPEAEAKRLLDANKEPELSERLAKHIRKTLKADWNREILRERVRINAIGFFYESPDVGAFLWALARENDGSFVGMSKP